MPTSRLGGLLAAVLLFTLGAVGSVASPATAAPASGVVASALPSPPAGCGERRDASPNLARAGSWYQQTQVFVCGSAPTKTITAHLLFTPCCGFVPGDVVHCTAYFYLVHIQVSRSPVKRVDCTTAATRAAGGLSSDYVFSVGSDSGIYDVEGYADITRCSPSDRDAPVPCSGTGAPSAR